MVECKEVAGRIVRSIRLYGDGPYGPEVSMDFEDGTNFTATFLIRPVIEGKVTRDNGGEPTVLYRCVAPSSS